jgi:putative FmdB family regulatory protein
MPTYDYACPHCGPFEAVRRMAQRDEPAACPECSAPAARAWLTAPRLADMPADRRAAMATNERSTHAPEHSSNVLRSRHPAGCGCCKSSAKADPSRPPLPKSFANRRPWMISH